MVRKNPAAQALAKLRLGIKEKPSARKKKSAINNLHKAWQANRKPLVSTV